MAQNRLRNQGGCVGAEGLVKGLYGPALELGEGFLGRSSLSE